MVSEQQEGVISGISAKFPECFSLDELEEKLLTKSVLVKADKLRNLPMVSNVQKLCSGKIPEWNMFDNTFFGIPATLLRNADPLMGMMLERSFEAILDAGISPYSLKGHNIGVFVAPSLSDNETLRVTETVFLEGAGMVGNSRAMMANRISYCFNFTGPSYSTEASWVSSDNCLQRAVTMVSSGLIEGALVATANNLLHTSVDCEYDGLGLLSTDGVCRPFDADANGLVRSEAVVAFYIQRRSDAKRIYGTVKKVQSVFLGAEPCAFIQLNPYIETFLKRFYEDLAVKPEDVAYVEAHGICHKEIDAQELNALAEVFCSQKKTPQLIGSLTGNAGHCDNCAGLVSTAKAVIAMNTGVIPPTINYNTPNPDVPALVSGKLKPVTEPTDLPGNLVAVNTISAFGSISHVLLQSHDKVKETLPPQDLPADGLFRLVTLQARNEQGVKAVCEKVASMAADVEFVSLVNDAFKSPIPAYLWRGYAIIPTLEDKKVIKYQQLSSTKRPLWFIFSGMGSQWTGMGRDLLQIPEFASSILRCDKVLRPKGLDILHILSSDDATIFDNILNCFVGITAVQIGLIDVLTKMNIVPDGIIGHSVGELGCAYADGCFTAEETILAAYARGKASLESLDNAYIKGMMAAVGLGYNEIKDKLPPSIDVACHNSQDSCTLSGPTEDVINFVEKLKSEGVFARAVSAGGIAYHSRYIKTIAPKLLKALKETVPNPKPRSSKWVCTSAPQSDWNTEAVRLCSPEYHTNNLLNPVYFEEGCKHLPDNAVLVEIAPHGLLQAILRRSISSNSLTLTTTSRTVESNLLQLLRCLGELYLNGVSMDVSALYPKVEYPVSRGTPSVSPLATWDHKEENYGEVQSIIAMCVAKGKHERVFEVNPTVPEYQDWKNHCIEGQVVVPIFQLLMYPLQMILTLKRQKIEEHFIIIEDATIRGNIEVNEFEKAIFTTFSPSSLKFEVSDEMSMDLVISGKIVDSSDYKGPIIVPEAVKDVSLMEEISESVYIMLSELGCDIGSKYQTIKKLFIGTKECLAKVKWNEDLITFVDSLIKIIVIFKSRERRILLQPNYFTKLTIDVPFLMTLTPGTELEVYYNSSSNKLVCQGAELLGLSLSPLIHKNQSLLSWSQLKFQPYFDDKISAEDFLSCGIQTAAEDGFNSWSDETCTVNILVLQTDDDSSARYTQLLKSNFISRPNIQVKIVQVDLEKAKEQVSSLGPESLIIVGEYSALSSLAKYYKQARNIYFITYLNNNGSPKYDQNLKLILVHQTESGKLALLKKVTVQSKVEVYKAETLEWMNDLRRVVKEKVNDHPIVVVTHSLTPRQILPSLSKEPYAYRIRTIFIQDQSAPQFSLSNSLYSSQISYDLSVNILSEGAWGSLRSMSFKVNPCKYNLDNLITSSNENLAINCLGLNTTNFTLQHEPSTEELGFQYVDYSGMLKGQRVMGVASFEPESNSLSPDPVLMWPVPADWTLEDAVTAPVSYTIAYYCIYLKANVAKGEHVLVHAGFSPLGQAMISVALQAGAKVFASVMNEQEVKLLNEKFPNMKSNNIFMINNEDINVAVRKRTGGKGVEVIINCLRGNYFQSTVKVADVDCRIIHLSEIRIEDREIIGLCNFFANRSVFGVSLNSIGNCSNESKIQLQKALKNGIAQGIVRPLKKRIFRLRELTDALRNLQTNNATEKTVVVSKYENQILPANGYFQCNMDDLHIIAGSNVELKFELAEWLIHHGARKIVLLNDEGMKRVNRVLHRKNCSTIIYPSSCLETPESALQFLKDTLRIGTVSSIFCVCMDESGSKMKNLDLASRELLPRLQQFVSLLGKGSAVCASRSSSGLPACSIQSASSLQTASKVLPYLFSLLTDTQTTAKSFFVSDHTSTTKSKVAMDSPAHLPTSVEELYVLGRNVESHPKFVEEITRSPRYSVAKFSMQPLFIIPGLGRHSLKPLFMQLMHPTFCCRLPAEQYSVEELTEPLVEEILRIKPQGPYNILGESWGGALAVAVSRLLESQGHHINLILIQGIPKIEQSRLRDLCRKYDADLGNCILNKALSVEAKNHISWRDRLTQLLQTLEPDVREHVSRGVTSLCNQLTSFLKYDLSKVLIKGTVVNVTTTKSELFNHFEHLSKFCQKPSTVKIIEETSHCQLLASPTTARAINENMVHSWKI